MTGNWRWRALVLAGTVAVGCGESDPDGTGAGALGAPVAGPDGAAPAQGAGPAEDGSASGQSPAAAGGGAPNGAAGPGGGASAGAGGTSAGSEEMSSGEGPDGAGADVPTSGGGIEPGAGGADAGANDAGGNDMVGEGGGGAELVWPNPDAPANSDPWLQAHHNEITVMRPRVLVLDVQRVGQPIETVTERIIAAVAEGSRYHGYSNPDAPAFLAYEIEKIVDLRDPTAEYPSFWPPGPPFDVGELFTEDMAPRYGFEDPDQTGGFLSMCELFERGIIHELWIAAEAGVRAVYENQSRMQRYDADLNKRPGSFQDCTNGCYHDPGRRVNCAVSVRMQEVNKGRGPGCFTHAAGHALENMFDAVPYLRDNASRFFYQRLDDRYGMPYPRLYDIDCFLGQPAGQRRCGFPTPTTLQYDAASGPSMTFDAFGQGCGDIHHKPNIYGSGVVAAQACEHYGLRDGPDGQDQTTLYSQDGSLADDKMAEYERAFPDCDGGWQTYLRQSMPGYQNGAFAEDGTPMMNWWPFLFY